MESEVVPVVTGDQLVTDVSAAVARFCAGRGDGLCHLFAPHATAGLALMELGSASELDLAELLGRLLPRDDRYHHRHGSRGHGADHLLPVFVSPSLVLPVAGGEPMLGVWQSVVMVDANADNPRRSLRCSWVPAPS